MITRIWHGSSLVLADGFLAIVEPVRMPASNAIDTALPIRSAGPVNFDRVTKTWNLSFTINRQHANLLTAAQFRCDHNNDLANVADCKIEWFDPAVGATVTATITGAAWQEVDPVLIGCATKTTYRVSGGPVTVVRDDEAEIPLLTTEITGQFVELEPEVDP